MKRSIRALAGLGVAALAIVGLAACDGPTVALGRVTVSGAGTHPAGVAVTAYADDAETVVAEVLTDADGNYRFGDRTLAPGTYRLRFNHDEWWGGATWATATPVDVSTTAPITVSPTLAYRTATISGTVLGYNGDVGVSLENVLGGPTVGRAIGEDQDAAAPGIQYTVTGLPAGTYRFGFGYTPVMSRNTVSTYSDGAYTASTAPVYDLAPSASATVNAEFPVWPVAWKISTLVTDGTTYKNIGYRHYVLSADTLEVVSPLVLQMSTQFVALSIPPIPVRILLIDPSGRLRPTFAGETAANPTGTVFDSTSEIPEYLTLIGRDCTKGDFFPGADHRSRDLAGKVLNTCDLRATDLSGLDLGGSDLSRADFTGADLTGANLTSAKLGWSDLSGVDLTGATVTNVVASQAIFDDTTCPDGTVVSSPAGACF